MTIIQIGFIVVWFFLSIIQNNIVIFMTGGSAELDDLSEIVIIPTILFFIGFLITNRFGKYKNWEDSEFKSIAINLVWILSNTFFLYFILLNFENDFYFKIIIGLLNLATAILLSRFLFKQNLLESVKIISTIQIGLIVVWLFLTTIQNNIIIFMTRGSVELDDLSEIVITLTILFFIGFLITNRFGKYKNWEDSEFKSIAINLVWNLSNTIILYFILLNFENDFYFKIIISFLNIIVAILISKYIFKQDLIESVKIMTIIQIGLFVIWLFISFTLDIMIIFFKPGSDDYNYSKIAFFGAFIFLFGISIFLAYWGDKVQLVKFRKTFAFTSLIPAIYYLMFIYISEPEYFMGNALVYTIIGFIIAMISIQSFKMIAYTTIEFQEIRDLTVHEKGKPLLEVKDLHVHYPLFKGVLKRQVGAIKAVNGVSFSVRTGETIGLVGESGCGKTTIAKSILGLVEKTSGEILFKDSPVPKEYSSYLRQKIQMVFQDPDASLNSRMKVVDIIAEPLKNLLGITNKTKIRKYVLILMDKVSLKREHMDRYPHEFSGGQKQRIVIARALACNPDLIILDEPTSALDVSVQAQILNLLKDLQAEFGYGFLFITHNLAVVNHIADRISVMYLGKIVETGSVEQVFNNLKHPYTIALFTSRSEIDPNDQEIKFVIKGEVPSPLAPPPGCTFNPRCSSDARTKECEIDMPHKIKIEEGHYIWCVNDPPSLKKKNLE
ncbi:MAG: ABC transporter ATP-binding protein [Promethearchaeota archaeon]